MPLKSFPHQINNAKLHAKRERSMRISIVFMAFILLWGCSSDPNSFFRSHSAIKSSLKSLEGRHLDEAIDRLGLPHAEQQIAGRKIFVWSKGGREPRTMPVILKPIIYETMISGTRTLHCDR